MIREPLRVCGVLIDFLNDMQRQAKQPKVKEIQTGPTLRPRGKRGNAHAKRKIDDSGGRGAGERQGYRCRARLQCGARSLAAACSGRARVLAVVVKSARSSEERGAGLPPRSRCRANKTQRKQAASAQEKRPLQSLTRRNFERRTHAPYARADRLASDFRTSDTVPSASQERTKERKNAAANVDAADISGHAPRVPLDFSL